MQEANKYLVYMHTCPNGKIYIGITSKKANKRWNGGTGYLHNNHFNSAIKKYGWNNIIHEILFENLTKEEADLKEIELIKEFKSNDRKYGYNMSIGGDSSRLGIKASEETKQKLRDAWKNETTRTTRIEKMSKAHKGKKLTEEHKFKIGLKSAGKNNPMYGTISPKRKKVAQYSIFGDLIKVWDYVNEAGAYYNTSHISDACNNKRGFKTCKGYIWKYYEESRGLLSNIL